MGDWRISRPLAVGKRKTMKKKRKRVLETAMHGVFLVAGLITVGCVVMISVYLILAGFPAIYKIGLIKFLFGTTWASTAT